MAAITGFAELEFWPGGVQPSATNFTLNGTTDQVEWIFQATSTDAITHGGFRQGTVTGTGPTFKLSIQGVADGIPDGTIKGGGSPVSMTWQPVGGNNTWNWKQFDNSYTPALGEWLALVISYVSGTIDGSNNCGFTRSFAHGPTPGVPYAIENDAGVRSRIATATAFGWKTASAAYGLPISNGGTTAFTSASTPDEKAVKFNVPTTFCSTYKVAGVTIIGNLATGGALDLKLYDSDGTTVLQAITLDTDNNEAAAARFHRFLFDDAPVTLNAGTSYRLSFLPTTGSHAVSNFIVASATDLDAYKYGSAWASASTRTDAGAWTDDTLTRYGINLLLSDVTQSGGSGGTASIFSTPVIRVA